MKILIIEDDNNKLNAISDTLDTCDGLEIEHQKSYHSGIKALLNNYYDLLLLDMSMPAYDAMDREAGGRPLPLAGRDILFQLRRRKIQIRVIVVTQFEDFDGLSLSELDKELASEFQGIYEGYVFYSIMQDGWREQLLSKLRGSKPDEEKAEEKNGSSHC